jgi:hypothetical protein
VPSTTLRSIFMGDRGDRRENGRSMTSSRETPSHSSATALTSRTT